MTLIDLMKTSFPLCMMLAACSPSGLENTPGTELLSDLEHSVVELCEAVEQRYAYFGKVEPYWDEACKRALGEAEGVVQPAAMLDVLERLIDDLYDPHANLNANDATSPRLVPSGTDLWFEYVSGAYEVVGIRPGTSAAEADIQIGDKLLAFNDVNVEDMIFERIHSGRDQVLQVRESWAVNVVVAGRYDEPRRLSLKRGEIVISRDLGDPTPPKETETLRYEILPSNIGYIRFNDSLGNNQTVNDFEKALDQLSNTRGLILDLRNTPSGGNTGVAEPILGRFVAEETPYQVTVPLNSPAIRRIVSPQGDEPFSQPIIVLVGRWTGSMGEGMAIGLDGMDRATIVGSKMARLAGGTEATDFSKLNLSVFLPTYDLHHLDGTPRHEWSPDPQNRNVADYGNEEDKLLERAIGYFRISSEN